MPSPGNFQQTPIAMMSPTSSVNIPPIQASRPPIPPRLTSMSNMRQVDHIHKQQSQKNMSNANNHCLAIYSESSTNEKLQERLLKRREQSKMPQMQHQMNESRFMPSQKMVNQMQLNLSQYPNECQPYNQQSLSMQRQRSSMECYYLKCIRFKMDKFPAQHFRCIVKPIAL